MRPTRLTHKPGRMSSTKSMIHSLHTQATEPKKNRPAVSILVAPSRPRVSIVMSILNSAGVDIGSGLSVRKDRQSYAGSRRKPPRSEYMMIEVGASVRFEASHSDGSIVRWTAVVVKVVDGIAYVRHPERARAFKFSPVKQPGLYKYHVEKLART